MKQESPKEERGTNKTKGKRKWVFSNRYKKLRTKHRELCRINAINRHLAIHEDVNELRSLGDVFCDRAKECQETAEES